jgi:glycerol-3-phosphate dehydrogenase (NAD(P)+)
MSSSPAAAIALDPQQVQEQSADLTILGAGAWDSALASLVTKNDHTVCLWSRRSELALTEAVQDAHVILSAISMKGVPGVVQQLKRPEYPSR